MDGQFRKSKVLEREIVKRIKTDNTIEMSEDIDEQIRTFYNKAWGFSRTFGDLYGELSGRPSCHTAKWDGKSYQWRTDEQSLADSSDEQSCVQEVIHEDGTPMLAKPRYPKKWNRLSIFNSMPTA